MVLFPYPPFHQFKNLIHVIEARLQNLIKTSPHLSGFTFIKNGLTLGYPIKESIESISDLCDEVIINVGFDHQELSGDDGTYQYLRDHFPQNKFIFLKSYWDPQLTKQGLILSQQTNIALQACRGKFCQYIQGDEVIHENDLDLIIKEVQSLEENSQLSGLIFKYLHFYGNVDVIKHTRNTYRREVRLIRNHLGIKSWLDAQGFRHQDDSKLLCKQTSARIFHYGWARASSVMDQKIKVMNRFYHGPNPNHQTDLNTFHYKKIWGLKKFQGTHPKYMEEWIQTNRNQLDILNLPYQWEWKDLGLMISDVVEKYSDYRIGEYKNFKIKK